jgi:hypothetical protein
MIQHDAKNQPADEPPAVNGINSPTYSSFLTSSDTAASGSSAMMILSHIKLHSTEA